MNLKKIDSVIDGGAVADAYVMVHSTAQIGNRGYRCYLLFLVFILILLLLLHVLGHSLER